MQFRNIRGAFRGKLRMRCLPAYRRTCTCSPRNVDVHLSTSSTARPSLNMIQIISNICSTDSSLNEMLQKENIQTCLQRAFSNDDEVLQTLLQDNEFIYNIDSSDIWKLINYTQQ